MVNTFFAILMWVILCALVGSFLGWLLAKRRVRYDDWAREQRRLQLLEIVREVRNEKGDYRATKSGIPKSRRLRRGPAKRARV
jgi:hypothetical protein